MRPDLVITLYFFLCGSLWVHVLPECLGMRGWVWQAAKCLTGIVSPDRVSPGTLPSHPYPHHPSPPRLSPTLTISLCGFDPNPGHQPWPCSECAVTLEHVRTHIICADEPRGNHSERPLAYHSTPGCPGVEWYARGAMGIQTTPLPIHTEFRQQSWWISIWNSGILPHSPNAVGLFQVGYLHVYFSNCSNECVVIVNTVGIYFI